MRYYPSDDYDRKEAQRMGVFPWMLELLKANPSYNSWGNYEDNMTSEGHWSGPLEIDTFAEMWGLDDLNELVNYYFEVNRASKQCEHCEGQGVNDATRLLNDTWYRHRCPPGHACWSEQLTEVEIQALWDEGRLTRYKECPTPETVNQDYAKGMGHDAINRWICVKARAQHQGVYGMCEHCDGQGRAYTAPEPHVSLQLWMLHPRKGSSRGLFVKRITREDLPAVFQMLKEADERNRQRFAGVTEELLGALMSDTPPTPLEPSEMLKKPS